MITLYTAFAGSRRRTVIALACVVLYAVVVCAGAVGMHGGWRSPIEMANAIGPNGLARGWHDAAAEPLAALTIFAVQAVIHAPIGALLAIALGRSRFAAVLAVTLGFDLSVTEQILCWLRRGGTATLVAPIVAALAALATWRVVCQARRLRPVRQRDRGRFIVAISLFQALAVIAACIGLLGYGLATSGMTPSQLATFLTLHATGRPVITEVVQPFAARLESLDRMNLSADLAPPGWAGADVRRDVPRPPGRLRMVGSVVALRQTIDDAQPGDVIEMLPGHYQLDGSIVISRAGITDSPVVLRAVSLGTVMIDVTTVEAFKVYAPHWVFENLVMRGICPDDTHCDHAFHVVGGAVDTQFHNLRLEDFNAHFKINGEHGGFPDGGRIEYVTLIDTHPRRTAVPVTPIDLDGASFWLMSDNFIADFAKAGGDRTSYGGYAKAAGSGNVFERNVVLCEWHLRRLPGQRIGLSFGGGGSDPGIRRDLGRSGHEQSDSVMRDNLIAACSDDGIYINRSPNSLVLHNTLIDTAGIDVRFPGSMARVQANLVDGPIRARNDGVVWQDDDVSTGLWTLFRGLHPVRAVFADPTHLDLRWQGAPPDPVASGGGGDLCHTRRPAGERSPPGAFADFTPCLDGQ